MKGRVSTFKNMPVFLKILLCFFVVWAFVFFTALSLTLRFSINSARTRLDNTLMGSASSLANSVAVADALNNMFCPPELTAYLDSLAENSADIDVISIANRDSVRVYHIAHDRIGGIFVGGDQSRALEGESYISEAEGTMGLQRRAFCPVYNSRGDVLGFVMTSSKQASIEELQSSIISAYLRISVPLFLLLILLSVVITFLFRDYMQGYDLKTLVRDYLYKNEVLNGLDEGILYLNADSSIQFANRTAEALLSLGESWLSGRNIDELIRSASGTSLVSSPGENLPTDRPNMLATVYFLENGRKTIVLKDRSDEMRRAEQLNGTRCVISALRANNHEFMNRLQVISGLLQMGEIEEAKTYIGTVSAEHEKTIGPVMQHIHNPNVAALLLGKLQNLSELEIGFTLLNNSNLPAHSRFLTTDEQVTVLGNLMENAMEATNQNPVGHERAIVLCLCENDNSLLIEISNSGPGIPDETMSRLFEEGYSTKASEGRGYGLTIVKGIVERHQAQIEVESADTGTVFSLIFTQKRERRDTV